MPKQKPEPFDVAKPHQTRSGMATITAAFESKILGVVFADDDGYLCEWSLDGLKRNLYPREKGEKHDLDLVNI